MTSTETAREITARIEFDAEELKWDQSDKFRDGQQSFDHKRRLERVRLQLKSGQFVSRTQLAQVINPPQHDKMEPEIRRAHRRGELVPHGLGQSVQELRHACCKLDSDTLTTLKPPVQIRRKHPPISESRRLFRSLTQQIRPQPQARHAPPSPERVERLSALLTRSYDPDHVHALGEQALQEAGGHLPSIKLPKSTHPAASLRLTRTAARLADGGLRIVETREGRARFAASPTLERLGVHDTRMTGQGSEDEDGLTGLPTSHPSWEIHQFEMRHGLQ
eukprot:gnl/Dysnectes_brevis/977_a1089_2541.p1 GENE.gnl/Dysnectes_brevis/977_a1089_2541~~gnl/Dysnectes_brevis/977_a1089_2541.p1  ORF type:complete len:277 (+),score=28.23 gnl/Dysnectes_brevis/977_a1089_2541:34-864(+)